MIDAATTTRPAPLTAAALLQRARRNGQAARQRWTALAEALFDGREGDVVLSDRERAMHLQLLRQIVGDIDATVRRLLDAAIEDGAAGRQSVPSWVVTGDDTFAFTALMQRGLLRDDALMETIAHRVCRHQLEQSSRPRGSGRWSGEAMLERPEDFLNLQITENSALSRRIAAYMVDRGRSTDSYGNPVLMPCEIEPGLHARLHWRVAAVLRHRLMEAHPTEPESLDALLEAAVSGAIRHSSAGASAPTRAMEAASSLQAAGLLTGPTLLRLLRGGEIPLFEAALARLAGMRPVLLRRLLYEPDGEGLAVVIRALGMGRDVAQAVLAQTRPAGTGFAGTPPDEVRQPDGIFDRVSREEAGQVLLYWQRSPEFLHAAWELESAGGPGPAGAAGP